jgi:nitrogen fixation NifU-like protein
MMDDSLRDLFEAMVLDHNRAPRHFGPSPAGAAHHAHGFNPVCNDEFVVHVEVEDDTIRDLSFQGAGCAISTASCSLMTDAVRGKTVVEAKALIETIHELLTHTPPDTSLATPPKLGKLTVLAGVHDYPARIKCATLPWHTLKAALNDDDRVVSTEAQR